MQKITTTIIILGLAIILIFGVVWPAYKMLGDFKGEIEKFNAAIAQRNQGLESLRIFAAKKNQLDPNEVQRLNMLAPAQSEPDLIAEVNDLALSSGLTIDSFNETSAPSQNQDKSSGILKQQSVELSFNSDYSNLKRFLSNMESSARLFDLVNLSLKTSAGQGPKSLLPLSVRANFNIYYK